MVPFITGSVPWSSPIFKPKDFLGFMTPGTELGLYDVVGYNPYDMYFQISTSPSSAIPSVLGRYDVAYALEYRALSREYANRWALDSPQPSAFLVSLRDSSYITYQDGSFSLWKI
jgi:hypothetical protein